MVTVVRAQHPEASGRASGTFTGEAWRDTILPRQDGVGMATVFFAPGSRTFWHRHDGGQILIVTAGEGFVGHDDGVERVTAGDIIWTPPGERHWHGASPDRYLVHTAISLAGVQWLEEVSSSPTRRFMISSGDDDSPPTIEGPLFAITSSVPVEVLQPRPASASGWSADQIRGLAVSGALARATEKTAEQALTGMRITRWGVDLFRPARVRPTTVVPTVVRRGRRVGVIDATLMQEGRAVARSRAPLTRPASVPPGRVWSPDPTAPVPPPAHLHPVAGERRLYYSDQQGWTNQPDSHHDGSRKQLWHLPFELVEAEASTPFTMAAAVADLTSLVVHWGTAGVQYINADIDLVLTRPPAGTEVGLSAVDRAVGEGISTGTAVVFDRTGPFGRASVVAVANPIHGVDPANRRPDLSAFTES